MAISLVLFDLGDVVATWDPTPRLAEYAARAGVSEAAIRQGLAASKISRHSDRGLYSAAEMKYRLCELIGCDISHDDFMRLEAIAFAIRPEIVAIAEAVSQHSPIGILANNSPMFEATLPRYFPELLRVFSPILFSFQFGHVKPDPELFEAVHSHLGLNPNEILLVDDKATHVAAAASAGWDAVQYQSESALRRSLAERGVVADGV